MSISLPRTTRLHLLAIGFYGLLAFIILYAIIFNNGVRVPGFDYFNYNWNFWWIRHALSTPGLNVYVNDFVMAPHTINFGYHALTAFWYPVWALIEPLAGTLTAMTVIIFLMCFLNGYVLFVLLLREGAAPVLALLGGALLQASPVTRYFYYNNHINLGDWFWLPASILLWQQVIRAAQQGRAGRALIWGIVLGTAIWGIGHTDLQFPIFVAFLLVPYALWTLWRTLFPTNPALQATHYRILGTIMVASVLALVVGGGLLWFAGPLPYMRNFEGALAPGPVEDRPGIPFPRGYFSLDPVWWWWNTPTLGGSVSILLIVSLVVAFIYRRQVRAASANRVGRWFWLAVLIPPLLLSMGPNIDVFGVSIPMPFRLLHAITNGNFRMPWRLAPIFVVASAVYIALTWTPILFPSRAKTSASVPKRSLRPSVTFALVVVILLSAFDIRLYETAPLDPVLQPYDFYAEIGREQGAPYDDEVILEVPTAAGTGEVLVGETRPIQYQMYGMIHGKRTLNGFVSRTPVENFWPIRYDDPLLAWLGQRRFLEADQVEPELRQIINEWPVGYIVVHQDDVGRNGPTPQEIIGYLNSLPDLLCPVWVERDAVVYRTSWHPDGCPARTPAQTESGAYRIDIGSSGDEKFIGWGWHWPEVVGGSTTWRWTGEYPQTKLYVDLPAGAYQVSVTAQSFVEPRQIRLLVNDVPLQLVGSTDESVTVVPDSLQTLTFTLPAELVGQGEHLTVTIDYDSVIVPQEIGQSEDPRKLAVAVDSVEFIPQ
ncbi:MAG: hypothetical protein LCI00_18780 [Chloroflexi bacterium]|nr:hypothetical protein [Chloroflexota bacterium]MCC6894559.1 hypothetical protein [Anaerolineae bacterium]